MIYTIPKGEHYSHPRRYGLHMGRTEETFLVRFNQSCLYEAQNGQYKWNKGAGWIYGLFSNENSIRWAWRPKPGNPDILQVGIYLHCWGKIIEPTETIELPESLDEDFKLVLENHYGHDTIYLHVHGEHISQTISATVAIKPRLGWLNQVYFGGSSPSPHKVTLSVKRV